MNTTTTPPRGRPSIAERAAQPICPNCGGPVERRSAKGPRPTFCAAKGPGVCKREHSNRHIVEGRALAALVKAWRIDRGSGEIAKQSFVQICQIADQFNAADNAYRGPNGERRPRADLYAAKLLGGGTMFFDRQGK